MVHSRFLIIIALLGVSTIVSTKHAQAQSHPIHRLGRFLGIGWGNGYHTRTPGPVVDYYHPYTVHNSSWKHRAVTRKPTSSMRPTFPSLPNRAPMPNLFEAPSQLKFQAREAGEIDYQSAPSIESPILRRPPSKTDSPRREFDGRRPVESPRERQRIDGGGDDDAFEIPPAFLPTDRGRNRKINE